jgi:hypothetical protein
MSYIIHFETGSAMQNNKNKVVSVLAITTATAMIAAMFAAPAATFISRNGLQQQQLAFAVSKNCDLSTGTNCFCYDSTTTTSGANGTTVTVTTPKCFSNKAECNKAQSNDPTATSQCFKRT